MFAPIGQFFTGLAVKFGLWLLGKALAGLINGVADDDVLEKVIEAFDAKIDAAQTLSQEAGKAARARLIRFAEKLKENLMEADGVN